jgi:hypothetical protein
MKYLTDELRRGAKAIHIREQIQEDIMTYMDPLLDRDYELSQSNIDDLCQIVVDNFKNLEE